MGSIWSKIAALVIIVVAVFLVIKFWPWAGETEFRPKPKTFQDVIREDDKRLRAEPELKEPALESPELAVPVNKPGPVTQEPQLAKPPELMTPKYEQLELEQKVDAERLLEMAIAERKMARLPGMSYKRMVDYCREIISKYPDSVYAAKARRILGEVPRQYWDRYKITAEEINPGK